MKGDSLSEARPEFYERQKSEYEPTEDGQGLPVDTTTPLAGQVETVINAIREKSTAQSVLTR